MKKTFKVMLVVISLILLGGCFGGEDDKVELKGITLEETEKEVYVGDLFNLPSKAKAKYSDGNTKLVDVKWSPSLNLSEPGETTYVASYVEAGDTKTAVFTLIVKSNEFIVTNSNEDIAFDENGLGISNEEIIGIDGIRENSNLIIKLNGVEIKDYSAIKLSLSEDNLLEVKVPGKEEPLFERSIIYIDTLHVVGSVVGEGSEDWEPEDIDDLYNGISKMEYLGQGKYEVAFRAHYRVVEWMRGNEDGANFAFKFAANGYTGGTANGMEYARDITDKSRLDVEIDLERSRESSASSGLVNIISDLEPAAKYNYKLDTLNNSLVISKIAEPLAMEAVLSKDVASVDKGTSFSLPEKAKIIVGGVEKEELDVQWSKTADTNTAGTFVYEGVIIDNNGKEVDRRYFPLESKTVEFTLTVLGEDTTAPVINLEGAQSIDVIQGETYSDPGYVATDNKDGDITSEVIVGGDTVDTSTTGSYIVTYNVSDAAGNEAPEVTRTVNVVKDDSDTTAPEITLVGDSEITLLKDEIYEEPGYTATDDKDGDITSEVVVGGDTVDTSTTGSYILTYNVSDAAGNAAAEVTRKIIVSDKNFDISLTSNVVLVFNELDVNLNVYNSEITEVTIKEPILGEELTLDVTSGSASGMIEIAKDTLKLVLTGKNSAGEIVERVDIITSDNFENFEMTESQDKPNIILNGESTLNLSYGETYVESGAKIYDADGNEVTDSVEVTGTVDTEALGEYLLKYNYTNADEISADEVLRTVNVVDETAPVITINGDESTSVTEGSIYVDEGATAQDNVDGDISSDIQVVSTVNTSEAGIYTVTYTVLDSSGNESVDTRTVEVVALDAPVIELVGESQVSITVGSIYVDEGATATDSSGNDITNDIIVDDSVNTSVAGIYTVTYNVTDSNGKAASQVTRTVEVLEGPKPITGYINYKNEGIMPGTSNFYISLEADDPNVVKIEVQIKKGDTMWNDSGDYGDTIVITNGTEFVYLVGKNSAGEIIVETTMDVNWSN